MDDIKLPETPWLGYDPERGDMHGFNHDEVRALILADREQRGRAMSRDAFGDPPESQEAPDLCPLCGNDWHTEDCEFGKEVARRLKAERDAHRLAFENEQLRRDAERLQGLLNAAHQIMGELARPSGI